MQSVRGGKDVLERRERGRKELSIAVGHWLLDPLSASDMRVDSTSLRLFLIASLLLGSNSSSSTKYLPVLGSS